MAGKITQAAEVELSIKGTGAVKSLKTELREARQDAINFSRQFGEFSPQAIAATKRMAELKDEMEDFGHRVNALNPDKFSQIGTAAQSLAHGFSAAQGAAALFGAESENVQKAMMKVQGAMALSQGLMGLKDSKEALGALAVTIKTNVVGAFATMKGAIISTGIGALIVAVGSLVGYFYALASSAEEAAEAEQKALDAKRKMADEVLQLDQSDITRNKTLAAAKLRNKGASEEELLKLERDYMVKEYLARERHFKEMGDQDSKERTDSLKALQDQAAALEVFDIDQKTKAAQKAKETADKAREESKRLVETALATQKELAAQLAVAKLGERDAELKELEQWYNKEKQTLQAGHQGLATLNALQKEKERKLRDAWAAEDQKVAKENADKLIEIQKKALEEQQRIAAEEYQAQQKNTNDLYTKDRLDLINQLTAKNITKEQYNQTAADQELAKLQRQIQDAHDYGQQTLELETQLATLKLQNAEAATAKQIELDQKERESKILLLNSTLAMVRDIGTLLTNEEGKRNKISKAFALAQLAIDTAQAISSLMKNSEANPTNAVTFGLAGAAQFAAGIARIAANVVKATQLLKAPAPTIASAAAGTGGGRSSESPQFAVMGQDIRVSKLNKSGDTGGTGDGGGMSKVPVVEYADIRKVGRRIAVLENGGTL